jgi:ribosome-binding protein aMBF1 (putative translation factor)
MQPAVSVKTILVAYNEQGWRIGETHHRARISDETVEKIRDLREYRFWTYKEIASHFELSVNTIKKICSYTYRTQRASTWKRVERTHNSLTEQLRSSYAKREASLLVTAHTQR